MHQPRPARADADLLDHQHLVAGLGPHPCLGQRGVDRRLAIGGLVVESDDANG